MARYFAWIAVLALAFTLAGCVTADDGNVLDDELGPRLVKDPNSLIADVPQPIGFHFIAAKSHAWSAPPYQYARYLLQARAKPEDVVAFYRSEPVVAGWTPAGEESEQDALLIKYTKPHAAFSAKIVYRDEVVSLYLLSKRRIADSP